ncbi:MAG: SbmA/BacA-like family transporter, partial [Rhizobiaceae bacterium]
MFASFFPNPRLFFPALILWSAISVAIWYSVGADIGEYFGFKIVAADSQIVGLHYFWSQSFLWFDIYFLFFVVSFAALWMWAFPHKWQLWSILVSSFILFSTYFSVQVSVALNNWRRPFFDSIQNALSDSSTTTATDLYVLMLIFLKIAFMWIGVYVVTKFVVSHYIFRWRTA